MNYSKKKHVLVIDDDADFTVLFSRLLQKLVQYNIVKAKDGMEGILKSRNQKFDYIFTDFHMPKVTGDDFINTVRRSNYNQDTPIILMSSSNIKLDEKEYSNIFFLQKPIQLTKLKLALSTSDKVKLTPRESIDIDFINSVVGHFKEILINVGNFKDITKTTTQKLECETSQHYDYYGCIIIHSEKFNGIITIAFPAETFEEYIIEYLDNTTIQSVEEIFEAFIQTLVTKTKKMLIDVGDPVQEINSVFGVGHTELLSSRESILEFYSTFESNKGQFYVQVSVWN
ncbi:response regulator [Halobacteriovorax sp. HLS]|uniref:response regulator n=1 Tax=Halobacteriovorax sp. HLS TaxID=2234000 RepID=UPI000FDBE232|nr:response regulator [Halobacteriovorax sp. HLS]